MNQKPIRRLVVDANPGGMHDLLDTLDQAADVEIVSLAPNRQSAHQQAEISQSDVMLVDLMLTGCRSIDVINLISREFPEV